MLRLYFSPYCPYAQRPRVLLARLGVEPELREVDLADRDAEFLALCPSGKVPLLEDDGRLLHESAVICQYLAARLGWDGAWHEDLFLAHRQRLALAQWDGTLAPAWYRSMRDPEALDRDGLGKELDFFEQTLELTGHETDNLLGIACAPHWLRMGWTADFSPLPGLLAERPALKAWLDRAADRAEVRATAPEREDMVRRLRAKFGPPADA
jgi:glutathione S-transferase